MQTSGRAKYYKKKQNHEKVRQKQRAALRRSRALSRKRKRNKGLL